MVIGFFRILYTFYFYKEVTTGLLEKEESPHVREKGNN